MKLSKIDENRERVSGGGLCKPTKYFHQDGIRTTLEIYCAFFSSDDIKLTDFQKADLQNPFYKVGSTYTQRKGELSAIKNFDWQANMEVMVVWFVFLVSSFPNT